MSLIATYDGAVVDREFKGGRVNFGEFYDVRALTSRLGITLSKSLAKTFH